MSAIVRRVGAGVDGEEERGVGGGSLEVLSCLFWDEYAN